MRSKATSARMIFGMCSSWSRTALWVACDHELPAAHVQSTLESPALAGANTYVSVAAQQSAMSDYVINEWEVIHSCTPNVLASKVHLCSRNTHPTLVYCRSYLLTIVHPSEPTEYKQCSVRPLDSMERWSERYLHGGSGEGKSTPAHGFPTAHRGTQALARS